MAILGDLLIRGGTVIDPRSNVFGKADVLIKDGRVVDLASGDVIEAAKVIDATGFLVLPGLIDYHAHVFYGGTEIGVNPDTALLSQGITTAVDQGSAGVANFNSFYRTIINNSQMKIFAYLNVSPAGLSTLTRFLEPLDPKIFDLGQTRRLFEEYRTTLLGIKVRQSSEIVGTLGLAPLKAAIQLAENINKSVVVHTTNPPCEVDELISLLRPGDVFTHVYQGKGSNIISKAGEVKRSVIDARNRGVIFDTADGRGHYAFSVAESAISRGFEPDIISTDIVKGSLFDNSVFGLPLIMTKYLNLGIPLFNVIKACTESPAELINMQGKIGTLAPGAYGDVSIFELKKMPLLLNDVFKKSLTCKQVFIPRMTVLNGDIVYRSMEF
jgi:Predicted amidohydrolase